MTRYLVTGATGFLGRHLVRELSSRGHSVVALARHTTKAFDHLSDVAMVSCNVMDGPGLERLISGCTGVFHCAGGVSRDPGDADEMRKVHVLGTRTVLASARRAGATRVVLASSSGTVAVSESPDRVAVETDTPPLEIIQRFPYYRAKLFAEQESLAQSDEVFQVLAVNPSLLLGPGDIHGSSTGDVRRFLDRSILAVPPGGLSFVDARDAALGMALAMTRGHAGERYLLGAANLTFRAFFDRLARASGVPAPRVPMPRSRVLARGIVSLVSHAVAAVGGELPIDPASVEMAQLYWYLDSSKAERELGWRARDPQDTLSDTLADLRDRQTSRSAMS